MQNPTNPKKKSVIAVSSLSDKYEKAAAATVEPTKSAILRCSYMLWLCAKN